MTNHEAFDKSGNDLTVAEFTGDNYPSPVQIANTLSEGEIRDALAQQYEAILDTEQEIARLQSLKQRQLNERMIYIDAFQIARDKDLE
jgi:hypothetical protein